MGIHGNATCVMNYDGATGFLLGEANRGLAAMFTMMNEARIGVGLQGLAQGDAAYQPPPPTPASACRAAPCPRPSTPTPPPTRSSSTPTSAGR